MALSIKVQGVDEKFLYNALPQIFSSIVIHDATKNRQKYKAIETLLKTRYHTDLNTALKVCCKGYSWHITDNIATFRVNPSYHYKSINISLLIRLVNDGNLSVKGTCLFSKALKDLEQNLKRYYRIYILTKGQKIWQ